MTKLKITKILSKTVDEKYKNNQVTCDGKLNCDGNISEFKGRIVVIKEDPEINKEYEVGKSWVYNNVPTYLIKSDKPKYTGGGNRSPQYTLDEYDKLFDHAISQIEKYSNRLQQPFMASMVSTYIISAQKGGVKI